MRLLRFSLMRVGSAALWALLAAAPAAALPLAPNATHTTVEVTQAQLLNDLCIVVTPSSPLGSGAATTDALGRILFPVTGGEATDLALLDLEIEHLGSSLTLTFGQDAASVTLTNLVIRPGSFEVLELVADVSIMVGMGTPTNVPGFVVFDMTLCPLSAGYDPCIDGDGSTRLNGFGLRLTEDAAQAIGDAFGFGATDVERLRAPHLGIAYLDVAEIPEPGTLALLLMGGGGLLVAGRRRRIR